MLLSWLFGVFQLQSGYQNLSEVVVHFFQIDVALFGSQLVSFAEVLLFLLLPEIYCLFVPPLLKMWAFTILFIMVTYLRDDCHPCDIPREIYRNLFA
jgi:hypothetical protein